MLFTLSLQKMRDLEVPLPVGGVDSQNDTTLFLQASESGTYYLKQGTHGAPELITTAELRPRLERYRDNVSEPRVFIRSDGKAKFGDAIFALDQVNSESPSIIRGISVIRLNRFLKT